MKRRNLRNSDDPDCFMQIVVKFKSLFVDVMSDVRGASEKFQMHNCLQLHRTLLANFL
jgi:hypothetical protein